jgi:hypothetical protein
VESDQVDRSAMGEGRYANYAEIGHNAYEFVFDFGQLWLDGDAARVYLRVITTPETAERLYSALKDALAMYRDSFGEIRQQQGEDGKTP